MTWLALLCLFVGCAQPVPRVETFDRLSLGLRRAQVEEMLGRPLLRSERMSEYRLAGGEAGYVAFDRRGRVTAWLRETPPRLRSGLVPLTWETYERLRLGTDSESLLVLLGEPVRREEGRWHYRAPSGHQLILQLTGDGLLEGKSWGWPLAEEVQSAAESEESAGLTPEGTPPAPGGEAEEERP